MRFSAVLSIFLLLLLLNHVESTLYKIKMERLSSTDPWLSSWQPQQQKNWKSDWLYNYNVAHIPLPKYPGFSEDNPNIAFAVRAQNLTKDAKNIYDVGPSYIVLSYNTNPSFVGGFNMTSISREDVLISPEDDILQRLGAEDPRVVLYDDVYYLFYTAVHYDKDGRPSDLGKVRAQLALATCRESDLLGPDGKFDVARLKRCWKLQGPILDNSIFWSKSGALLVDPTKSRPHLLFWGDSDIGIATSTDLLHWTNLDGKYIVARRADHFDSELVESGPEPLALSDGNYLFLYNSARKTDAKSLKPGWDLEYNLGFVILDKYDPTKVLLRSDQPIFSPVLDWEKCDLSSLGDWAKRGLTPNVVFVEGWRRVAPNTFAVFYQGCDSVIGLAVLSVDIQP